MFPRNLMLLLLIKFVMAVLNRQPNTQILRLCLLPVALLFCIRTTLDYSPPGLTHPVYSLWIGFTSLPSLAHVFDFAFTTTGMNKINSESTNQKKVSSTVPPKKSIWTTLSEANELMSAYRGIGYEWGRSVPLPVERRPLERWQFLRASLFMFFRRFITFDILVTGLKLTPSYGNYHGGPLYLESLPLPQRILLAMVVHAGTGFFVIYLFETCYLFATLIAVGIFNSSPSLWPLLFDHPWKAESIQEFWGRRWHQLTRRYLLVSGGFPCEWLFKHIGLGRVGLLFGSFLASGLYHELPSYMMDGILHWEPIFFFLSQAFLICLEHYWKAVTGKRVGGRWGRLWVYFSLLTLGQIAVNSWLMRGLGSGLAMQHRFSPSQYLLQHFLNGTHNPLLPDVRQAHN